MGMTVADLSAKLGLDTGEFDRGMDGVVGKAGRAEKVLNGVSKAAMAGAVAAGALIVKSLDTYNDFGTSINTLTRLTGMSSQAASKLTGQWQRFGVESQSGINATKFLAKNLDAAQHGSKAAAETFKRLGIDLKDAHGKLRSVDTILPQVRDKLSQMDDAGQRTALTLKLFGRGGADMLGWLTKSPGEIKKVNKELADLGMVWGGKQVKDWKALKDAQREMGLQWTALQINLAQTLLPSIKTLMGYVQTGVKDWNNLSDGAQGFILKATGVVGVLGLIAPKAIAAAAALKTMFAASAAGGAASAAGSVGGGVASGVAANVASSAGIGASSKGYQALTASKMMGGAGVTPVAAALAATTASMVALGAAAVVTVGAMTAGLVIGSKMVADERRARGDAAATPLERSQGGRSLRGVRTSGPDTSQQDVAAEKARVMASTKPLIQKIILQAQDATGPAFAKLMDRYQTIKDLGRKGIDLTIDPKKPTSSLQSIQARIMATGKTANQAHHIMEVAFGRKITLPKPNIKPVTGATAAAQVTVRKLQAELQRRIAMGRPDNSGIIAAISAAIANMNGLTMAANSAAAAVAVALSHSGGGGSPGGRPVAHSGGVFTGSHSGYSAILHGREAVLPLDHPSLIPGIMAKAGLPGGSNGPQRLTANLYMDGQLLGAVGAEIVDASRAAEAGSARARRRGGIS